MKTKHNVGKGQQQAVDAIERIEEENELVHEDAPGDGEDAAAGPAPVMLRKVPPSAERLPLLVRLLVTPPPAGGRRLSLREIAASTGYSKSKVMRMRDRLPASPAERADLLLLSARQLHLRFHARPAVSRTLPDFATVARRRKEPGQTLRRLWEEYRQPLPETEALSYEQYTRLFKRYRGGLKLAMRQKHLPGMQVCVDFSGKRPYYYDPLTGHKIYVELFVGALRYSCYAFACVVATQSIPDWLDCGRRMLEFFGGVPRMHICDNLKAGVTKPGRVPIMQAAYLDHGIHYGSAMLAAQPFCATHKATVELEIQHVQRHLLPTLAQQTFHSIEALNVEISRLMQAYNAKPFSQRLGSRESQFLAEEKPALLPLPETPYIYYERQGPRKVPRDYHLPVLKHHYSVPSRLAHFVAEARVSVDRVQIWIEGECVADHPRGKPGGCTTDPAHQETSHHAQSLRTPEQMTLWAEQVGPRMAELMAAQFKRHKVALQGLQAAFALQDLGRRATFPELEAAAAEALALGTLRPADVKGLLRAAAARALSGPAPAMVEPARSVEPLGLPGRRRRSAQTRATAARGQAVCS